MILYENSIRNFRKAVENNRLFIYLQEEYFHQYSRKIGSFQKLQWKFTLDKIVQLVEGAQLSDECGIRLDYVILNTLNRFEVLLTGNVFGINKVILVEMLPWEDVKKIQNTDLVEYCDTDQKFSTLHPSLLSISYKKYLESDVNEEGQIVLVHSFASCVYLFGCNKNAKNDITDGNPELQAEAPVYYANESQKITEYINTIALGTRGKEILEQIHRKDQLCATVLAEYFKQLDDNDGLPYQLYEEQKYAAAIILKSVAENGERVFFINGGPGTGKTALAISLMHKLINKGKTVAFLATTAGQIGFLRNVSDNSKNLFLLKKFNEIQKEKVKKYDLIFVDEIQNALMPSNLESLNTVFGSTPIVVALGDENQTINGGKRIAKQLDSIAQKWCRKFDEYDLNQDIRYSGKGSGICWLAHQLQLNNNLHYSEWDTENYDISIIEDSSKILSVLAQHTKRGELCRILVKDARYSERNIVSEGRYYLIKKTTRK